MKQQTKCKQTEIGKIPTGWEIKKLGDCLKLNYGKSLPETERKFGKVPVFGSNGVTGFHNQFLIKGPGIIVGRKGSVGGIHLSENDFWPIDTTYYLIQKDTSLDLKFLYYKLLTLGIDKMNSHAAVPGLNRNDVYRLEIEILPLPVQLSIAKILSSLDEKIELNNKMNKTLEAIGQALFKKWFIDKRKGEWEISKIGDELKTILGGTPDRTKPGYWNGNINWINSGKVNEFRIIEPSEKITELGLRNSATKILPKGSVVLAITGATLGQFSKLEIDTCANQSVIGILENEKISSEYIYFWIKNEIGDIISHQTGGAQQHINKNNLDSYDLLIPDDKTLQDFNKIIQPIFKQISINCFQNQTLSSLRDTLLPKLMSGEVRVR